MKCGHCKRDDAAVTVEHVRGCDGKQQFSSGAAAGATPTRRERRDELGAELRDAESRVPTGRYALRDTDGAWKFYHVNRPPDGRWVGNTFLSVQAGDESHPIKWGESKLGILLGIGADPAEASRAYGRELGRCGICNRTLTNPESIAAGIGPVCAAAQGWG